MKKEYKRSKADLILLLIFFIPLSYIFGKASTGYFLDGSFIYGFLFFLVFLSIVSSIVSAFVKAYQINITNDGLTVKKIFNTKYLKWNEISEFGRYQKLGYNFYHWTYYFKSLKSSDNKVKGFSENFPQAEEIISTIFNKAKSAKFISEERSSKIPLISNKEIVSWEI